MIGSRTLLGAGLTLAVLPGLKRSEPEAEPVPVNERPVSPHTHERARARRLRQLAKRKGQDQ
jgi:hypothetical protein